MLDKTGILDVDDVVDDLGDNPMIARMAGSCKKTVNGFRVQVRRKLSPENIQAFVDTEKMAALGAASGTVVGILLL